jgi:hypothetical protein
MTPARATMYVGIAAVLVAWLAAASGVSVAPRSPEPRRSMPGRSATQALADDVQAQASRLRERMARAPVPRAPVRNPFAFETRAAGSRERPLAAEPGPRAAAAAVPTEPPLQLVGVAERRTPAGLVRTALITADSEELFMLVAGDTLGGRYKVTVVDADAVELLDLVSGTLRRLALR